MHAATSYTTGPEPVALADMILPALLAEMAGPRRLGEACTDFRARQSALADITADLLDDYIAGGGDEWFETGDEDAPAA